MASFGFNYLRPGEQYTEHKNVGFDFLYKFYRKHFLIRDTCTVLGSRCEVSAIVA
jgi:hypothetical protein